MLLGLLLDGRDSRFSRGFAVTIRTSRSSPLNQEEYFVFPASARPISRFITITIIVSRLLKEDPKLLPSWRESSTSGQNQSSSQFNCHDLFKCPLNANTQLYITWLMVHFSERSEFVSHKLQGTLAPSALNINNATLRPGIPLSFNLAGYHSY